MFMKLTEMEKLVILAFPWVYDSVEDVKSDLGSTWINAAEIAKKTDLRVNTVKGVLGSLVKKDLVYASEEVPIAECLTEKGADVRVTLDNEA